MKTIQTQSFAFRASVFVVLSGVFLSAFSAMTQTSLTKDELLSKRAIVMSSVPVQQGVVVLPRVVVTGKVQAAAVATIKS